MDQDVVLADLGRGDAAAFRRGAAFGLAVVDRRGWSRAELDVQIRITRAAAGDELQARCTCRNVKREQLITSRRTSDPVLATPLLSAVVPPPPPPPLPISLIAELRMMLPRPVARS